MRRRCARTDAITRCAFARRFESIIYFQMPRPDERLQLWRQGFSPKARLDEALDLKSLAQDHMLSGGSIMNAIRYASLQAIKVDSPSAFKKLKN